MERDEEKRIEGRILELDRSSYARDILRHTNFLSLSEQAVYHRVARSFSCPCRILFGGHAEADRAVLFFLPSYLAEELPAGAFYEGGFGMGAPGETYRMLTPSLKALFAETMTCIRIDAAHEKFAEPLTHRDYLGALMNLGIERDMLGDILTDGTGTHAFLFCMQELAAYIEDSLTRVRHTSVRCVRAAFGDCDIVPQFEELRVNVASERLDAVVAAVYKLSRSEAASLIAGEAVFADGRSILQAGTFLKEGTRVSVRGHGKFIFEGTEKTTKKGRLYIAVRKYV